MSNRIVKTIISAGKQSWEGRLMTLARGSVTVHDPKPPTTNAYYYAYWPWSTTPPPGDPPAQTWSQGNWGGS